MRRLIFTHACNHQNFCAYCNLGPCSTGLTHGQSFSSGYKGVWVIRYNSAALLLSSSLFRSSTLDRSFPFSAMGYFAICAARTRMLAVTFKSVARQRNVLSHNLCGTSLHGMLEGFVLAICVDIHRENFSGPKDI